MCFEMSRVLGEDLDCKIKTSTSQCLFEGQFTMAFFLKSTEVCLVSVRI